MYHNNYFFIFSSICIENLEWSVHWSCFYLFFFYWFFTIPMWVYSELTNIFSCNFFLFDILTFVCMLSSLSLLSVWWEIIYWFRDLLCIEVHCTIPTLNLQQNPFLCCYFCYLNPLVYFCFSSSILFCSLSLGVLLCYICSTFLSPLLSSAFDNSFLYVYKCCSWNILVSLLCQSYF